MTPEKNRFYHLGWRLGFHLSPEMLQRPLHAFMTIHPRLPAQQAAGARDVGPTNFRIVLRQRLVDDGASASSQSNDLAGEVQNRDLVGIAQVDRIMEVGAKKPINPFNQVGHITEAAG